VPDTGDRPDVAAFTVLDRTLDWMFWTPPRIDGWSAWVGHIPFASWIVENARPRVIVELGCFTGVSFCAFCEAVRRSGVEARCYGVDTWAGDEQSGPLPAGAYTDLAAFVADRYGGQASLLRKTFDAALADFRDGSVDLLHIDGLHTYESVRHDFESWLPKLSARAVVLFHDVAEHQEGFGVWRLWEELTARYPGVSFPHCHGLGVLQVGVDAPGAVRALCTEQDPAILERILQRFAHLGRGYEVQAELFRQRREADMLRGRLGALTRRP
jgi:hypothetical protein